MTPARIIRCAPILSAALGLELICNGLGRALLHELAAQGPLTRAALIARLHAGSTAVYECLKVLRAVGLIESSSEGRAARHTVNASGRGLVAVAGGVEAWFARHPEGPLEASVGWRAFQDFGEAWRNGLFEWIVRLAPTEAAAARGLPGYEGRRLTELLAAMGEAGMVEQRRAGDGLLHYRLSAWAARGIAPLAALARWETTCRPPGGAVVAVDDAVVAILAALPLVRLGVGVTGVCTLTAEAGPGAPDGRRTGTVWARLRRGRVVAAGEGAPPCAAEGWAVGSFEAWFAAVLDGRAGALRLGGRDPGSVETVAGVLAEFHVQLAAGLP